MYSVFIRNQVNNSENEIERGVNRTIQTTDAVTTSILSTRWRILWTSVTNLHFEDGEFNYLERWRKKTPAKQTFATRTKFTQFVNRILLLLNPPCIREFCLRFHLEHDPFYLNSWICAAIGPLNNWISLWNEKPTVLLLSHFCCSTLAVLKLNGKIHFNVDSVASICFPSLQTLHLSHNIALTIASNTSVSFPKLSSIHIKRQIKSLLTSFSEAAPFLRTSTFVDHINVSCLVICIPSLTRLKIHMNGKKEYGSMYPDGCGYKLQIDAPALQYLELKDTNSMCEYVTAENLSSLLEAEVKLKSNQRSTDYDDDVANSFSNNILKFIGGLSKVKILSVSGFMLKITLI